MEHEDNAHFDNYLQNRLTESLQIAGGAGDGADVADELVPNIGAKSGEQHDDEEEWKYIKEVQQSEKQQQLQEQQQHQHQQQLFGSGDFNADVAFGSIAESSNGIAGAVDLNIVVGNGSNGNGSSDVAWSLGNGRDDIGSAVGIVAYEEEDEVEVIKNDGDFSTNSNTTTTTTSTGEVEAPLVVDAVAAAAQLQAQLEPVEQEQQQQQQQQEDEEEPSSVATTYGTSSMSENNATPLEQEAELPAEPQQQSQQQQQQEQQEHEQPSQGFGFEPFNDKENDNPLGDVPQQRPVDLLGLEEAHSQLNPNATEFVPSFGSQPASPVEREMAALGVGARQLIGGVVDDVVAESPRKGARMDIIAVPDELEFDSEAAQRPHELEQGDDLFGAEMQQLAQEQLLNGAGATVASAAADDLDFQRHDHGPETSVDLDADIDTVPVAVAVAASAAAAEEAGDIMKRSIYAEHNASIEDILNSVQPLPNAGGDEQEQFQTLGAEKELLHVEEKEHVSQSPSTEELQLQAGGDQLYGNEDPMQASFYMEHTSSDAQQAEQSFLLNTSAPVFSPLDEELAYATSTAANALELVPETAAVVDITPSPLSSTEEKHLVEDTKETLLFSQDIQATAGAPPQVDYAAIDAAAGHDNVLMNNEQQFAKNPFDDDQHLQTLQEFASQPSAQEQQSQANDNEIIITEQQPQESQEPQQFEQLQQFELLNQLEQQPPQLGEVKANEAAGQIYTNGLEASNETAAPVEIVAPASEAAAKDINLAAAAAVAAIAATTTATIVSPKPKASASELAKKPAARTSVAAAKPKPAAATTASAAAKKAAVTAAPAAAKRSSAGTTSSAAPRPRTAPAASKSAASSTAAAARPPLTARKPLTSSASAATKAAPRTTGASSARPATAPTSKPLTKTTAASSARSGALTARKPLTSSSSTAAATARPSASKPSTLGVGAAGAAPAKPRMISPRSTVASQLRKAAPTAGSALASSARSPTKPLANGAAAKSGASATTTNVRTAARNGSGASSTSTTTTTTITKTFTARPAPKFTHSTSSSTARRALLPPSSTSPKLSPLKAASSPGKASPLKAKAKENAKPSPIALKGAKKPDKPAAAAAANGEPKPITQNGNGLHELPEAAEEALPVVEQPQQAAEVALLNF